MKKPIELIKIILLMLINEVDLTKENLLANGMSEEEIDVLLKRKYISTTDNLKFNRNERIVELFYKIYMGLLKMSPQEKPSYEYLRKVLDLCFEINPYNRNVCISKLLSLVPEREYPYTLSDKMKEIEMAFVNFNKYLNTEKDESSKASKDESSKASKDDNLLLFLFALIIDVPDECRKKLLDLILIQI